MISCEEYRRQMLAEPQSASPLLREHRRTCEACAAFTRDLGSFEDRLRRALAVDVATKPEAQVVPLRPRGRAPKRAPRWLALAASLVGAVGIGTFLWIGSARQSLAAAVVAHMAHEPAAWQSTDQRVEPASLAAVLRDAHVRLASGASRVSYAQSCQFRFHQVPHLVVQLPGGPVTVMVLAHENVPRAQRFDEGGYQGMLVPVPGHGSLAVILKGKGERDVQRATDVVMREVQFGP